MENLKFRAFNGEELIILENSGLQYFDFEGSYSLGFTVDAYSEFWAHEQYGSSTEEAAKFPITQFIGIQDKNMIDVFVGDYVETGNGRCFEIRFGEYRYHEDSPALGYYMYSKYGSLPITKNIEVIGNIYQNTELQKHC